MAPIVDGLEQKYGDRVTFVRYDFDDADQGTRARALGARVHPEVILLKANGQIALRFAGETPRLKLERAIEELLGD